MPMTGVFPRFVDFLTTLTAYGCYRYGLFTPETVVPGEIGMELAIM
jgi:hypothetical protein